MASRNGKSPIRLIPTGIWVLGFVSMLMDVSSEMIHALLPIYLVTVLGTSALTVGLIEGIAEATASITKVFSGALSDWLGRAEAAGDDRLRAGGLHQADLPAGALRRLAGDGALCRSRRQGHPGRTARRPRRRHRPAGTARREFWPPPGARHDRRVCRTAACHRRDDADGGQLYDRLLDRGHPGVPVLRADRVCGQGTGAAEGPARARALLFRERPCDASGLPSGGSRPSPPPSPSPASARRSWC